MNTQSPLHAEDIHTVIQGINARINADDESVTPQEFQLATFHTQSCAKCMAAFLGDDATADVEAPSSQEGTHTEDGSDEGSAIA